MGQPRPKSFEITVGVAAFAPARRIVIVAKPFAAVGRCIGETAQDAFTPSRGLQAAPEAAIPAFGRDFGLVKGVL